MTSTSSSQSGREIVIVDAVRSPIGRRNGGFAGMPQHLFLAKCRVRSSSAGIDPSAIEQVVGGCVSQVGEQSFNVTRTAWLGAGLPIETAATTVDTNAAQVSRRPTLRLHSSLGTTDVAMACGVES